MSATSKSKTKEKSTQRAGKEQPKVSVKPSPVHANGANGSSASACNPLLAAFNSLDVSSSSSLPPQSNGRFKTIDDPEDNFGYSPGMAVDYDCLSNNGSCSGESEDQKEKPTTSATPRLESVPGSESDKRDKIRQKNERKHQRQRERRAQDLHERSNAFLTSRKLDSLSHQLVAMGFPIDRATMAIITNEGRMEESVAWLLQEGEDDGKLQASMNLNDKSRIKVDITDELTKVAEMEVRYKCTRQDVERAVITCEGDLLKAENSLRAQKQAASVAATLKSVESVDSNNNNNNNKIGVPNHNQVLMKTPIKGTASVTIQQQQRLHEKDLACSKAMVPQDSVNRNLHQTVKKTQLPKIADWSRTQSPSVDKRWLAMSSSSPLDSSLQVLGPSLSRPELQFTAPMMGHELKSSLHAGALKEPFVVMRRPKQNLSPAMDTGSSLPPSSAGWYHNADILAAANGGLGNHSMRQLYLSQNNHLPPADFPAGTGRSSQLAVPASLGLFTDWGLAGSSNSSSQNDWNSRGSTSLRDYTSIDWSLDLTSRRPLLRSDAPSEPWPSMRVGGNGVRPFANGAGVHLRGLEGGGGHWNGDPLAGPSSSTSHEWTNPFEGRDIFRIPRQYVASPSVEKPEFKMEK